MHWGPAPESASASIRRWMMGKRKAAVLPEPVWAHAIMSLEAKTIGMPFFWIGVGLLEPDLVTFSTRIGRRPAPVKLLMALGLLSPVTDTGMASYLSKLMPLAMPSEYRSLASPSALGTYISLVSPSSLV